MASRGKSGTGLTDPCEIWLCADAGPDREDGRQAAERHARICTPEETGCDPVVHYSEESEVNARLGQALTKSLEWGDRIPTGVFYRNELVAPYAGRIADKVPNYEENPPAAQRIERQGRPTTDVSALPHSLDIWGRPARRACRTLAERGRVKLMRAE